MHGWKTEALKLNAEKEGVLELIRKISAGGNSKKSINELEEELRLIEDALAMAPRLRTISTNDATIEKLADLEAANPAGILFLRDEIFGLLEKVEANENRGDKSFLIEGFEGQDSYKIHRIGRAAPAIKSHTLTIGGTTQPGPIRSFINNCAGVSKANDGMCQRFSLTFYADSEMPLKYVDKKVDTTDEEAIKKAAEKVNKEVINIILSEDDQFKTISFSSEAQQKFIEIYNELSEQIVRSGDSPDFQAHLGKYPKLIPALALIFDVIENGFKNDSLLPEEISLANLLRAESWSKVLFEHAKWLYGLRDSTLNKSTLALHRKIVSGDVVDSMTIRSIYRKNWSFLKSEKDVITAIEGLMELGWCCCQEIKGSRGAPSIVIRLHPNLRHKHS